MLLKNNAELPHILTSYFQFALILGKQIYAVPVFRIQKWEKVKISSVFNVYVECSKELCTKLILARQDKASCETVRDVVSYDSPVRIMKKMRAKFLSVLLSTRALI